jgi:hypothetical protein
MKFHIEEVIRRMTMEGKQPVATVTLLDRNPETGEPFRTALEASMFATKIKNGEYFTRSVEVRQTYE